MLGRGADVFCVQLFPCTKERGHKEVVRIYAQSMNGPNCGTTIKYYGINLYGVIHYKFCNTSTAVELYKMVAHLCYL